MLEESMDLTIVQRDAKAEFEMQDSFLLDGEIIVIAKERRHVQEDDTAVGGM